MGRDAGGLGEVLQNMEWLQYGFGADEVLTKRLCKHTQIDVFQYFSQMFSRQWQPQYHIMFAHSLQSLGLDTPNNLYASADLQMQTPDRIEGALFWSLKYAHQNPHTNPVHAMEARGISMTGRGFGIAARAVVVRQ